MQRQMMNEKEAAAYLGLSARTLQQWRYLKRGPRYVKVSERCVRYRLVDLDDWVATRLSQ